MSTFIYSEDDNENRQCSPILIPEKPLNSILTFGSTPQPSRLNSSSAGKHNTTADVLKPSTKDSEFQAVTIPRAKLKQLINALGASVHLLQESVDPVRSRSFLETDFEDDIDEDNDSDAADGRNTKYLNMKAPSRWRIKHNHETLAEAFNQGSGPWFFEEYQNLYDTEPFENASLLPSNDLHVQFKLRRKLWELLLGQIRPYHKPPTQPESRLAAMKVNKVTQGAKPFLQPISHLSTVKFNRLALFVEVLSSEIGLQTFPDESVEDVDHRLRMLVSICQASGIYTSCSCIQSEGVQPRCKNEKGSHEAECELWSKMTVGSVITVLYAEGVLQEPDATDIPGHRLNAARILQSLYPLRFFISQFDWMEHIYSKTICPEATHPHEILEMEMKDLILLVRKEKRLDWVRAAGTQFAIKLINVDNLQLIGGISIQWTNNLYEHLELSFENYPVLKLYWFTWATLDIPIARMGPFAQTSREELLSTYHLLFGVSPQGFLRGQSHNVVKCYNKIETHPNIKRRYPHKHPREFTGKIVTKEGRPYDYGADYHLPVEETHIASLATAGMQQDLYERYPAFEDNLRILVAYMDSQKPGGLRGLWYDKRDSGAWYAFWAVLWIGGISLLVGLLSLGVSITQAVASFKALNSDSPISEHGITFLILGANQTRQLRCSSAVQCLLAVLRQLRVHLKSNQGGMD